MGLINRNRGILLRAAVSLALLWLVFNRVDSREILDLLPGIDPLLFSAAVALAFLDRLFMAFKWTLLTGAKKIVLPLMTALKVYLIGGFFGLFLPTAVGSDIVRTYYTIASRGQGTRITASVLIEKILGVVSAAGAAVIGVIILATVYHGRYFGAGPSIAVVLVFLLSSAGAWILLQRGWMSVLAGILKRLQRRNRNLSRMVLKVHGAFVAYRRNRTVLAHYLWLSVLEQMLFAFMNYVGARAMGLDVDLLFILGVIPGCRILTKIPISIDALGVQEGLYVLLFAMVGLSEAQALGLSLVVRAAITISLLPGGPLYVLDALKRNKPPEAGPTGRVLESAGVEEESVGLK